MLKVKLIAACVCIAVALVVILQNTQVVETRLLFQTIDLPQALLLGVVFAAGLLAGILFAMVALRPKRAAS